MTEAQKPVAKNVKLEDAMKSFAETQEEAVEKILGETKEEKIASSDPREFVSKYAEWLGKRRMGQVDEQLKASELQAEGKFDPADYGAETIADQVKALWKAFQTALSRLEKVKEPFIDLMKTARFDSNIHKQILHLESRAPVGEHVAFDMLTHFRTWQEAFLKSLPEEDRPYFLRKLNEWMESTSSHRAMAPKAAQGAVTKLR